MGFGAWKGRGRVSCTWESVGSSLDVRNKSASGSSSQVKSSKRVGKGNLMGCSLHCSSTCLGWGVQDVSTAARAPWRRWPSSSNWDQKNPEFAPDSAITHVQRGECRPGYKTLCLKQTLRRAVSHQPRNRDVPEQRRNPVGPGSICPRQGANLLSIFNASERFFFPKSSQVRLAVRGEYF